MKEWNERAHSSTLEQRCNGRVRVNEKEQQSEIDIQSRERERERVFALLLPSLKQMLMVSPVVDCSVVIPHRKSTQVRKTPLSLQNFWSCGKTVFNSTSLSSFMSTKVEETKIRTFLFLFFFSSLWPLHVIVNEKGTRKK